MAHFLSEATHSRLETREKPMPGYGDDAESRMHRLFQSKMKSTELPDEECIRSMVVATRSTAQGQPLIWTAEEGDISLRNIRGQKTASIEKKKNTLVNCMLTHDRYLWVGLNDGYIRIFDQHTLALSGEIKQHAGPVMCLLSVGSAVFSGGSDWQIYVWDPKSCRCVGQLSGHQNQVNCLAVEGDLIFSGGEDQAIRCWTWDGSTRSGEEKIDNWPKVGHAGGIRAIVINEIFLFSASSDGGLKVWNTQNGQLVQHLDQRDSGHGARVQITCLQRDPAAQRIWAGSTDGIINVWDAQQLHLVGSLDAHHQSYVKDLLMCVRLSCMRVWGVNKNGVVKVWRSDTDEDADWSRQEDGRQLQVEELRSKVIANYRELERRQQELKLIEDIDKRRKRVLAAALGAKGAANMRRIYYMKITRWARVTRERMNRRALAESVMSVTAGGMRLVYWQKLMAFSRMARNLRRKQKFCDILMSTTASGRRSLYWRNLQEYSHQYYARQKRDDVAASLMRGTTRGTRAVYFLRWRRLADRAKLQKKKDMIARALLWNMEKGQLAVYWHKMTDFARREKRRYKWYAISDHLQGTTSRGTLNLFYRKWRNWHRSKKARGKKDMIAGMLLRNTKLGMTKVFWYRWREWAAARAYTSLDTQHQRAKEENDEVAGILEMQAYMSEEQIEEEQKRIQDEIQALWDEIRGEEKVNAELDHQNRKLKRELQSTTIRLKEGSSELEQVMDVMFYLKAKSIHCAFNFEELSSIREQCAKQPGGAVEVFKEGLGHVRKQCWLEAKAHFKRRGDTFRDEDVKRDTFIPEPDGNGVEWVLWDDLETTWEKKRLKKAANGIRNMVVAFDTLVSTGRASETPQKREFVINSGTMLMIINSVFRVRREELQEGAGSGVYGRRSRVRGSSRARASAAPLPADGSSRRSKKQQSQRTRATEAALPDSGASRRTGRGSRRRTGSAASPARDGSRSRGSQGSPSPARDRRSASSPGRGRSRGGSGTQKGGTRGGQSRKGSRKALTPAEKPWLGWTIIMEDQSTGMPPTQVILNDIIPSGPASLADMQASDVITMFGEDPVTDISSFKYAFQRHAKIGTSVQIKFERQGEEYEATLVVRSFADKERIIQERRQAAAAAAQGVEGDA
eukprot:TRINITY_DN5956_c0_g1_i1.p1 TRINITY_DN5956_c0_g1~~TRINITY_DN5956_c0_g1_i1.p1  ORF type:complete len:1134 (+),score=425.11 TRINITY_DN5956_c0_g1_i1:89-3490(+)